jgi:hypothetical protein
MFAEGVKGQWELFEGVWRLNYGGVEKEIADHRKGVL